MLNITKHKITRSIPKSEYSWPDKNIKAGGIVLPLTEEKQKYLDRGYIICRYVGMPKTRIILPVFVLEVC